MLPLLGETRTQPRGEPSRWGPAARGVAGAPKLVVEVRYDKVQGSRFRHGTKLLRWRDDKDPDQCTVAQVEQNPKKGDPTVESLLAKVIRQVFLSGRLVEVPGHVDRPDLERVLALLQPLVRPRRLAGRPGLLSSLHWNFEPASVDANPNVAVRDLVFALGPS